MKKTYYLLFSLLFIAGGCSGGDDPVPTPTPKPEPPVTQKIPISLNYGIVSRATDTAFETGDKIGLYVVNYNNGSAGTLQNSGNHVNNMQFSHTNSVWTPTTPIYWKDETTKADFYAYYPYGAPANVTAYPVTVAQNQSTEAAYKASLFLWGKTAGVTPTAQAVNIQTGHLLSSAVIKVVPGDGFTQETLAAATVSVKINQVKTGASINLITGVATATGDAASIVPLKGTGQYKAIVVPQALSADNFITVTIDSKEYNLDKEFTFEKGKQHTFTVTVSKTANGINVGINPWVTDEDDHGGVAN